MFGNIICEFIDKSNYGQLVEDKPSPNQMLTCEHAREGASDVNAYKYLSITREGSSTISLNSRLAPPHSALSCCRTGLYCLHLPFTIKVCPHYTYCCPSTTPLSHFLSIPDFRLHLLVRYCAFDWIASGFCIELCGTVLGDSLCGVKIRSSGFVALCCVDLISSGYRVCFEYSEVSRHCSLWSCVDHL